MQKTTHLFILGDEKKHSVRYEAVPSPDGLAPVLTTTIYVNKAILPRPYPRELLITVEPKVR